MVNYENGKIYKIINEINNIIYYGSTTMRLCQRMARHRECCRKGKTAKLYNDMRDLGIDNFKIVLVEKCPSKDKEELLKKELEYITNEEEKYNKYIPLRTPKMWREDNKEHLKQYFKDYYLRNKNSINENYKKYYYIRKNNIINDNAIS